MVEVEHRPLSALKEEVLLTGVGTLDQVVRVSDVWTESLAPGGDERSYRIGVNRVGIVGGTKRSEECALLGNGARQSRCRRGWIKEVFYPEAEPSGAILIGGTDAALGGAHFVSGERALTGLIERHVIRKDQVRCVADAHLGDVDAAADQPVELPNERGGVDDHPWPDDWGDVPIEDTRGDQVQLEGVVADDDRVAGVVAALVANDRRDLLGEEVGGLPLPLVAPLESDDHARRHSPSLSAGWMLPGNARRGDRTPSPPRSGAPRHGRGAMICRRC